VIFMAKKIISLVLSLLILVAIIWYSDPVKLINAMAKINPIYIIAGLIISTISLFIRVLRWKVLLKNVSFSELWPIQLFGMAVSNLTPGKIAEPIKSILLKMRKNTPVSTSLQSIMWERIIDVIILIIFSIAAINIISIGTKFFYLGILSIIIFIALIAVIVAVMKFQNFGFKIIRLLRKFPILKNISDDFMKNFYETKTLRMSLILSFILTLIAWVLDAVSFYLIFVAFEINISFIATISLISFALLISIVSFLPGGLGSFEVIMIIFLGMFGVTTSTATASILLARFVTIWYSLFLGGLAFIYLSRVIDFKKFKKLL